MIHKVLSSPAARTAALLSGAGDLVTDPASQDLDNLSTQSHLQAWRSPENRLVFLGIDHRQDSLSSMPTGSVNPLRDKRVREAKYHSIDIETLVRSTLRGQAIATSKLTPSPLGSFNDPALEDRLCFDLARARQLMRQAGYPDGFGITLDCPSNWEQQCLAIVAMWAKANIRVRLRSEPRANFFVRFEKLEPNLYMFC